MREGGLDTYRLCQQKVVVFWLNTKIFEYRIRPEPLHMILTDVIHAYLSPTGDELTQFSI